MKFKIGDKIRIISKEKMKLIQGNKRYFNEKYYMLCSKTGIIVDSFADDEFIVSMDDDRLNYYFEPFKTKSMGIKKIFGDIVRECMIIPKNTNKRFD